MAPVPYRVAASELVQNELKKLAARAKERGLSQQVLDALKGIEYRLRIYPQFGEPLAKLTAEPIEVWVGCVPPLVVQYAIDEERRTVMIGVPIRALPNSGIDP